VDHTTSGTSSTALDAGVRRFTETWARQLVSAVGSFSDVLLEAGVPELGVDAAGAETLVWQEHQYGDSAASIWFGVPERACLTIASNAAASDDARLGLVREALANAARSTAEALNTGGVTWQRVGGGAAAPDEAATETVVCQFQAEGLAFPVTLRFGRAFKSLVTPPVEEARKPSASQGGAAAGRPDPSDVVQRFHGVDVPVRVVLGRATLRVRDLMRLTVGSLIELDAKASSPVELCVQDAVLAKADVVCIDGNYGVRLVDVAGKLQRLAAQRPPVTDARGRQHRVS
jgi:flagellar motor switch protein FliN/FliY